MFEIGLDLSSYKINASEFTRSRNELILKNIGFKDLEPHSIVGGEIIDSIVLVNGLKELWKNFKFKNKSVNIGLSGIKNIIKEIELPVIDEKEIENAIKYQVNDFLPIAKDNLIFDYYVIEKRPSSVKIMLVGVLKSMINNVLETVNSAGLNVNSIDLNCFSLYRIIKHSLDLKQSFEEKDKKTICSVYIGNDVSIIEFYINNEIRYPRFISSSVNTFIENLKKKLKSESIDVMAIINSFDFEILNLKEAKKIKTISEKNEQSANDDTYDKNNKNTDNIEEDLKETEKLLSRESMKLSANQLINEISRSIDHFLQENRENEIEKIIISGENFKNLDKYIENNIKHPIERFDICSKFSTDIYKKSNILKEINISDLSNRMLLSCGLAIRGFK